MISLSAGRCTRSSSASSSISGGSASTAVAGKAESARRCTGLATDSGSNSLQSSRSVPACWPRTPVGGCGIDLPAGGVGSLDNGYDSNQGAAKPGGPAGRLHPQTARTCSPVPYPAITPCLTVNLTFPKPDVTQ